MTDETTPPASTDPANAAADAAAVDAAAAAAAAPAPAPVDPAAAPAEVTHDEHPDALRLGDEAPVHPSKTPVAHRPAPAGPHRSHHKKA